MARRPLARMLVVLVCLWLVAPAGADAAARPDLGVSSLSNPPTRSYAGSPVALVVKTSNRGNGEADESLTSIYLSRDAVRGQGDVRIGTPRKITPLAGKKSLVMTMRPQIGLLVPVGRYRVIACADEDDDITESNERNNCRVAKRVIAVGRSPFVGGGNATGFGGGAGQMPPALAPFVPIASVADAAPVTEGDALAFPVTLDRKTTVPVEISYAASGGTAGAGDYAPTTGKLTFAPGETAKTVTVASTGEAIYETNETVGLTLSSPAAATLGAATAVGTITNDDTMPTVSVADASAGEGSPVTFTASLGGQTELPVTVNWTTSNGTASAPGDYTAASGEITFAPGETSKPVAVTTAAEAIYENHETVGLTLSSPSGATLGDGSAIGTITNDDAAPTLSVADQSVGEGGTLSFTVTKTGSTELPVTVTWGTADVTASAPGDYATAGGTLTFAAGETSKPASVTTATEAIYEGDETLNVALSSPAGATLDDGSATGTITNDDAEPTLSVADQSVLEGAPGDLPTITFTVTRTGLTELPITVDWATVDVTAVAPGDYVTGSGTLTFTPAQTSRTAVVTVNGDGMPEPSEAFTFMLSNPSGATLDDGSAAGTITDDD